MALSNLSQVIMRNSDLLAASHPLLVNMPADSLIGDYLALYPQAKLTCFNTDFEQYQLLQQEYGDKIHCDFSSQYNSDFKHDLVIITFPKSKAELAFTLAMISPFLVSDSKILVVGENKGGIKSCVKLTSEYVDHCKKIDSARHCSLFSGQFTNINKPFILADWFQYYDVEMQDIKLQVAALPGVFSRAGLDAGTALLLKHLPKSMQGHILDFGCGAGVISCFIAKKYLGTQLTLVDINALALKSAEQTLKINKVSGEIVASNGLSQVTGQYQHIVTNPPFHRGLKTHYDTTENFLSSIKRHIKPKGSITVVANSFLRYKPIMQDTIGMTKTLANEKGFAIYQCHLR
jgi:16S rRNA (guanine1207-N2)-methyltransferase